MSCENVHDAKLWGFAIFINSPYWNGNVRPEGWDIYHELNIDKSSPWSIELFVNRNKNIHTTGDVGYHLIRPHVRTIVISVFFTVFVRTDGCLYFTAHNCIDVVFLRNVQNAPVASHFYCLDLLCSYVVSVRLQVSQAKWKMAMMRKPVLRLKLKKGNAWNED